MDLSLIKDGLNLLENVRKQILETELKTDQDKINATAGISQATFMINIGLAKLTKENENERIKE